MREPITFDRFIRTLSGILIAGGLLLLINYLSAVLLPFFLACFVAYLIYPLVEFFQHRLKFKNHILSVFCTLTSLIAVLTTLFFLIVPPMIEEFGKVKDLLYTYLEDDHTITTAPKSLMDFLRENLDISTIEETLNYETLSKAIKALTPKFWSLISSSVSFIISIFTSFIFLLYLVFILFDYETISKGWNKMIPIKYRPFFTNLMKDVQAGMNRYFRGQALVATCVGVLFCIGFLIIDFPLAIGLGIFVGILNLVPYLQIVAFIPTILLALLKAADTGQNFWIILLSAAAVFVIVQIIQDVFIVPKIMGKVTGLNPAIILLSLSVWGYLMGVVGMIIALPLTTLLLSYYQRFIIGHEKIASGEENEEPNEHIPTTEKEPLSKEREN